VGHVCCLFTLFGCNSTLFKSDWLALHAESGPPASVCDSWHCTAEDCQAAARRLQHELDSIRNAEQQPQVWHFEPAQALAQAKRALARELGSTGSVTGASKDKASVAVHNRASPGQALNNKLRCFNAYSALHVAAAQRMWTLPCCAMQRKGWWR
jgi:hypothetical protein